MTEDKIFEILREFSKELVCKDAKLTIKKLKSHKCDDIIAGYYNNTTKDDETFWFSKKRREKHATSIKNNKEIEELGEVETILVILESPHKKEYSEKPYKPANGNSGIKLQKYFGDVLEQIFKEHENLRILQYRIILMNSIQYQCSLGVDTKRFRDHVWLKLWYDCNLKEDFSERLKEYHPKIILNLCTQGNHSLEQGLPEGCYKKKINAEYLTYCLSENIPKLSKTDITLQKLVSQQIPEKLLKKCVVYTAYHPAIIWSGENENICNKIKLEDITSNLIKKSF